jgi:hypothetical protein
MALHTHKHIVSRTKAALQRPPTKFRPLLERAPTEPRGLHTNGQLGLLRQSRMHVQICTCGYKLPPCLRPLNTQRCSSDWLWLPPKARCVAPPPAAAAEGRQGPASYCRRRPSGGRRRRPPAASQPAASSGSRRQRAAPAASSQRIELLAAIMRSTGTGTAGSSSSPPPLDSR